MRVTMVSVNHRTAPVDVREKLSISADRAGAMLCELRRRYPAAEFVLLSTCNRTELYCAHPSHEPPGELDLRQCLAAEGGISAEQMLSLSVCRENEQAVAHLFQVASGLESLVLGEPQILGQVRGAYERACGCQGVGAVLHKIFQSALAAAKAVRHQTGIDAGRVSVASVAVDFTRRIFDHFEDKVVVGIGTGVMAKLVLRHMLTLKPAKLWIANRTVERARRLAEMIELSADRGGARSMDDMDRLLIEADIVVSSTDARTPILTADRFRPLLRQRRHRPLFLIDIAVPRDIEPAVGGLRNVYLYNIDDLQQVVSETFDQRQAQVVAAQELLTQQVKACMHQVRHREVGQLVHALRQKLHDIGQQECTRTQRRLDATAPELHGDVVAEHTHRLLNKILHLPLSQLDHRTEDAPLGFYAAALRRLFQLEDDKAGDPVNCDDTASEEQTS